MRELCRMRLRGAGPRPIAALARSNAKDRTDLRASKTRLRCKDSTARIGAAMLAGSACRLADPTDADDRYESAHRGAAPEASMGSSQPDRTTSTASWAHTCRRWRALQARSTSRMRTVNAQAACQSRRSTGIGKSPVRVSSTCCLPSEHARSGDYVRSHAVAALARSDPTSSSNV